MHDRHNEGRSTGVEGEYLPPAAGQRPEQQQRQWWRRLGPVGAALAFLAVKFKAVIAILLQFKLFLFLAKALTYGWTFVLSLVLYVAVFGWKIGLVFIFVLLAHELGHFFAFRAYGITARLPVFIPFFGAFTSGAPAANLEEDAYIALAGPFTGLVIGTAAYAFALATNAPFWYACADVATFLNLFNMIPVPPFDGGRIVNAVWPPLWIAGFVAFAALAFFTHISLLFVIIIGAMGLPTIIARLRGARDPREALLTTGARLRVSAWYLLTAFGLFYVAGQAHQIAGTLQR